MPIPAQVRLVVANRGRLLAAVFAVVGVAALAGAGVVYANPPTDVVTEQVNQQSVSSEVRTSAVVVRDTSLYERGRRLTDRSVYFLSATPDLELSLVTTGPSGKGLRVTHRIMLEQRASRDGEVFWERTEVLLDERRSALNGRAESTATLNMTAVAAEADRTRSAIGEIGTFRTLIRMNVTYRTDSYSGGFQATSPLVLTGRAYWLDGELAASRSHAETRTRRVEASPDPLTYGGLTAVSILALASAGWILYRGRDIDTEAVRTDMHHDRYEEWISKGEFPTGTNKKHVRITSLEDLVDIAIDTNKRVVHDTELDAYAVIDGDLIYYYSTDPLRLDSWLEI